MGEGGGASPSNVGTSNDPSLNEVIASVLRNDVALAVPTVPIASDYHLVGTGQCG